MTMLEKLKIPFPPQRISWRVGSTTGDKKRGMALAYIDARDVMERLDEVCGADGWQCRYPHANGKTVCEIGLKVGAEWIWKADGAGDTDFEAEKGALSDAFKRAAVRWGIGRYLYDIPALWVEIEAAGKSFKIADKEHRRLAELLTRHAPAPEPARDDTPDSDIVADYKAAIDECDTVKAIRDHGAKVGPEIAKLSQSDQDRIRAHFASRLKALKQAENLAA